MKFKNTTITITIICLMFSFNEMKATGLGIYFPYYLGVTTNKVDTYSEWTSTHAGYGVGLVLDTRVAEDDVFNYRLNLGYNNAQGIADITTNLFSTNSDAYDLTYNRLAIENSFGFGFLRTKFVRLWAGPQIGLFYETAEGTKDCFACYSYNSTMNYSHFGGGLGFAPVFGANFNIGSLMTLALDMGYRYTIIVASNTFNTISGNSIYPNDKKFLMTYNSDFFLNFSVIFRINDVYGTERKVSNRKNKSED